MNSRGGGCKRKRGKGKATGVGGGGGHSIPGWEPTGAGGKAPAAMDNDDDYTNDVDDDGDEV